MRMRSERATYDIRHPDFPAVHLVVAAVQGGRRSLLLRLRRPELLRAWMPTAAAVSSFALDTSTSCQLARGKHDVAVVGFRGCAGYSALMAKEFTHAHDDSVTVLVVF